MGEWSIPWLPPDCDGGGVVEDVPWFWCMDPWPWWLWLAWCWWWWWCACAWAWAWACWMLDNPGSCCSEIERRPTDSILRRKAIKLAVRVLWTSAKIHTAPRRRRQLLKERELKTESIECGIDYHMLVLHPPPPPTVLRNSRCETSAIKLPWLTRTPRNIVIPLHKVAQHPSSGCTVRNTGSSI